MMNVLCFGEPLIRLATKGYERLESANTLEITYGGAETIVAISLASQGENVAFATKISNNRLGTNSLMTLTRCGVDTSRVIRSGERMGIYYSECGRSIRPSIVTYDRTGTAMAEASHADFDWDRMLNGIELFFFSGVTPAISKEMLLTCEEGLKACRGRGIKTVCDLNYRSTLWSPETARKGIGSLLPFVDELIASEDDIISISEANISPDDVFDYCHSWARGILLDYPVHAVGFVVRESDAFNTLNVRGGLLTHDSNYFSKGQHVAITDLSSTGSVFAASLVHGQCSKWDPQKTVDYATIASAYKATIAGDQCFVTENELTALMTDVVKPSIRQ